MDSTQQIKDKSVQRLNIIKATTHLEKLTQLDIAMDWCFVKEDYFSSLNLPKTRGVNKI